MRYHLVLVVLIDMEHFTFQADAWSWETVDEFCSSFHFCWHRSFTSYCFWQGVQAIQCGWDNPSPPQVSKAGLQMLFYLGYNLKNNIFPNILQEKHGLGNSLSTCTSGVTRTPDSGLYNAIQNVGNGNEASGFIPNIEQEKGHGLNKLYSDHN